MGTPSDPRDRVSGLLRKHDLYVEYYEIFSRWCFRLTDNGGKLLWQRRGHDPRMIRDSLLEYLEEYDKNR